MRWLKSILDNISRVQLVQTIVSNLWAAIPVGWTLGTGYLGYVTSASTMWIMVAMAASAAFVCVALLAAMIIQIWRDPLDKLKFVAAHVGVDLAKQRVNAARRLEKVQVGIQLRNDAHFPMSVILESAESSIEEQLPPRLSFPGPAVTQGASAVFFLLDAPIVMHNANCKPMTGGLHFRVRYGRSGDEKHILDICGTVFVSMENSGVVKQVWFNHLSPHMLELPSSRLIRA